ATSLGVELEPSLTELFKYRFEPIPSKLDFWAQREKLKKKKQLGARTGSSVAVLHGKKFSHLKLILPLNEGEEVGLQSLEAIETFRMLSPNYQKKKIEEIGITEDEYYAKQLEIKGEILEPLNTMRAGCWWDWPLRGWE
ncbi:hypothetical protein HAX54_048897, partial [Datura stramonium]|nr:hypothetical protein [Datura stramonium]